MGDRKAALPKQAQLFYGADYNPDQWVTDSAILDKDIELMREAGVTSASVGIFAWASLEPREGQYDFTWLDRVMDRFAEAGLYIFLATPSGRMPMWMQHKYPGIIRVRADGTVDPELERHNHCMTSPPFRKHVAAINRALADRYKDHPALALWHLGNELNGDCHCEQCRLAFHGWLKQRYQSLDQLNAAWWTAFWGYTFSDWSQIPTYSESNDGLRLDWRRFANDQHVSFLVNEMEPLKELTPSIPCTTNFMGTHPDTNYIQWAKYLDVVSNDLYPLPDDRTNTWKQSIKADFIHSLMRGMSGGAPWMQMECSPSSVNWADINKLKRPGVHRQEVLQMLANGADTIHYFQWRKGRGGYEKFHGAVVDHEGSTKPRVFQECAAIGKEIQQLASLLGNDCPQAKVALLFDWEARWALDASCGPKKRFPGYPYMNDTYTDACYAQYQALTSAGQAVDVLGLDDAFGSYQVVVLPALYSVDARLAERLQAYVTNGGILVGTYLTAYVDTSNCCHLGGFPGAGLRATFGIWNEEVDYLHDEERVAVSFVGNEPQAEGASDIVERIHAEDASVLATFSSDFHSGAPAMTLRTEADGGAAYYLAARFSDACLLQFYSDLLERHQLKDASLPDLPEGVVLRQRRSSEGMRYFLFNYKNQPQMIDLGSLELCDIFSAARLLGKYELKPYASHVCSS